MSPDEIGAAIIFVTAGGLSLVCLGVLVHAGVSLEPETAYRARKVTESLREYVAAQHCSYCRKQLRADPCTNCGAPA